jgi:hypothetical protein
VEHVCGRGEGVKKEGPMERGENLREHKLIIRGLFFLETAKQCGK